MTIAVLAGTGFVTMLAVVLAWAGVSKVRHPEPTRRALVALCAPATAGLTRVTASAYFLPFFALVAFCCAKWTLSVCVLLGLGEDLRIVKVTLRRP